MQNNDDDNHQDTLDSLDRIDSLLHDELDIDEPEADGQAAKAAEAAAVCNASPQFATVDHTQPAALVAKRRELMQRRFEATKAANLYRTQYRTQHNDSIKGLSIDAEWKRIFQVYSAARRELEVFEKLHPPPTRS